MINEDYRLEDARMDAQDTLEETLKPHRDDYALACWRDTDLLTEAFNEALHETCFGAEFGGFTHAELPYLNKKINEYFAEQAKTAISSMDDL